MSKPREFYLRMLDDGRYMECSPDHEDRSQHVIEKSAYDELKEKTSQEFKKIHEGRPSEWAYKILEAERDELKNNFNIAVEAIEDALNELANSYPSGAKRTLLKARNKIQANETVTEDKKS